MAIPQQSLSIEFTNRVTELEIVASRIETLQRGRGAFQCVLNFYGIPGVGKSEMLGEIQRLARTGNWPGRRLAPVLCALTSLDAGASSDTSHLSGPEILATLIRQIDEQPSIPKPSFYDNLDALRKEISAPLQDDEAWYRERQAAKRVADSFNIHLYQKTQKLKQPVILLFDDSDKAGSEVLDWLEFEVFSPLVQTDKVLLILAGSSPVRWRRFEVRRRVYLGKLHPPQESIRLVSQQAPQWTKVADKIVQLTFGLPTANETVVEALNQIDKRRPIDTSTFDQLRPELMERLITDLVERRLWQDVEQELWPVFHLVAPLRQFDVTTLRNILPQFDPERFSGRGGNYYLLMLNKLIDTALIEWSTQRKAYVLDDTLRHILALDMEIRQPELAEKIHQRAAELYERWLAEVPESRSSYLIEWLYHCAKGYALAGNDQILVGNRSTEELRRQLQAIYSQPSQPNGSNERLLDCTRRLVNELSLDDELMTLVGKQARDNIVQLVQAIESNLVSQHTMIEAG